MYVCIISMKDIDVFSHVILNLKAFIANNIHNVMNYIIIDIIGRITFHLAYEIFFYQNVKHRCFLDTVGLIR